MVLLVLVLVVVLLLAVVVLVVSVALLVVVVLVTLSVWRMAMVLPAAGVEMLSCCNLKPRPARPDAVVATALVGNMQTRMLQRIDTTVIWSGGSDERHLSQTSLRACV